MKKVIFIAMLLSLMCVCGLSVGVCYAEESSTYYYVNSGEELTVYSSPQIGSNSTIMQIPSTYAFKYVKEENNTFVEIEYNGCKGYVLVSDLSSSCAQVNAKWGNNPYAYAFNASDFNDFNVDNVTAFYYDNNVWTAESNSTPASLITVKNVYGYYKDNNQEVYFLIDFVINVANGIDMEKRYVKASDFSTSKVNVSNIPESEGYKAQSATDNNPPTSGNINSGDHNGGNNGTTPKDTSNSFERYILIAVIAVLCVVIIILIFAPTKKRRGQ